LQDDIILQLDRTSHVNALNIWYGGYKNTKNILKKIHLILPGIYVYSRDMIQGRDGLLE
jgi:hypothetical protein